MSSEKITVDRDALWRVLDFFLEDQENDFNATADRDQRQCHVFISLRALAHDLAEAGDPAARALFGLPQLPPDLLEL